MKSLILKDLYNVSHNLKSLALVLVFLAFAFIPSADVLGYVSAAAVICSTMVVTTFNFDEVCRWDGYAMIMPLSRRDVVAAKYISLFLFTAFGSLVGLVMGTAGGVILGKMSLTLAAVGEILASAFAALMLGMVVGGMNIPLILRFGPEKGRLLLIVSTLVPTGFLLLAGFLLTRLGVVFTETLVVALILLSPIPTALWDYVMFRISCRIFEKKEL